MKHRISEQGLKRQKLLCQRIIQIRLEQKRTRVDVAVGADLNPNYYGKIERGKTGSIGMRTLDKIRKSLGIKWKEFGSDYEFLSFLDGSDEDNEEEYYNQR
ncbi:MAG: helix-turn-helix transcriptional regulator [Microgenomates group bacterium]|jgi:transcriptional regulator with XRE-family HTH domain